MPLLSLYISLNLFGSLYLSLSLSLVLKSSLGSGGSARRSGVSPLSTRSAKEAVDGKPTAALGVASPSPPPDPADGKAAEWEAGRVTAAMSWIS